MGTYDGETILVTGGTGSIGSEIANQLLCSNVGRVVIFSRDEMKQYVMSQEIDDERLEFIMGDIRDYESIKSAFERYCYDTVFHAAAMKHLVVCENEPIECSYTNIIGTNNLVRLCNRYHIKRLITISTDKAAAPTCVMGAAKFIAERITLNGNSHASDENGFCCVRFGNVANSRGSVIPLMIRKIMAGKDIWVSDPDITRFIMRISDAVKLVLRAGSVERGGEIFVLKMRSFRLGDLAEVMKERIAPSMGLDINVHVKGLTQGEKSHEDLLNKEEVKNLLESDDLYLIRSGAISKRKYDEFRESSVVGYDSSLVEKMSKDELEMIVRDYLENHRITDAFTGG
jgi:UDP-N-acetylglucosamine 4,6-dehydratase